ncbi:MAG: ABC transporter ATP-binding protein [Lachnospiraceae bacterium]|nr:ABC transporter ATP-binding protein [Lachnospiraceae bacterium]
MKIENLKKSYGSGESKNQVLKGISLSIKDGDFVIILGTFGSGKSTLLNVISGLEPADGGMVSYNNANLTSMTDKELTKFRKDNIGYIFQQYFLLPNLNVDKNVKIGADLAGNKNHREIIDAVGLLNKLNKYPHELSGGEQQRVSVARALAKNPKILYLDEPTGALDEKTGRSVLDYIVRLKNQLGFTMVMVTHNQNIAQMADTVIRMNSGNVIDEYRNEQKKSAFEIQW